MKNKKIPKKISDIDEAPSMKYEVVDLSDANDRRLDFERNHNLIAGAYVDYLETFGRAPNLRELGDITGKCYDTLRAHIKKLKFVPASSPYRLLTSKVVEALYFHATKGTNSADRKLWFQVMEGLNDKVDVTLNKGITFGAKVDPNDASRAYLDMLDK